MPSAIPRAHIGKVRQRIGLALSLAVGVLQQRLTEASVSVDQGAQQAIAHGGVPSIITHCAAAYSAAAFSPAWRGNDFQPPS